MLENLNPNNQAAVGKSKYVTTEAPTNESTLSKVLPPINEEELNFVTMVDQHWGLHGQFLTEHRADLDWGLPPKAYQKLVNSPSVQAALMERGIDVKRELPRSLLEPDTPEQAMAKLLSPLQLIVANSMLDLTDQRSDKKKLNDLGVQTSTYQRWLRDKNFSSYLATMSENMLSNSQHEASVALLDKVKAGDLPSIKFYMEYTGRFLSKTETQQANASDFRSLMVKILEIITEECDAETGYRIGVRLKEATQIHAMAVDLTSQEIVKPQVAQMRELTPEMKELMEATGGELE